MLSLVLSQRDLVIHSELKNYHKFCFDQSLSEKDVAAVHRLLVAGDCGSDYTSASLPLPPLVEEKVCNVAE